MTKNKIKPGDTLDLTVSLNPVFKDIGLALHVEVTDPNGKILDFYTENIIMRNSKKTLSLPIALNAVPGKYRVKVVEVASGLTGEATFKVLITSRK